MPSRRRRFFTGFVLGIGAGLGIATAVAFWVSSLPSPTFLAKYQTGVMDAWEAQSAATWNPNHYFWPERPMPPTPNWGSRVPQGVSSDQGASQGELPINEAPAIAARKLVLPLVESRALPTIEKAQNLLTDLRAQGFSGRLVRQGTEIKVRMGPFDDPEEAGRAAQSMAGIAGPGGTIRPLE